MPEYPRQRSTLGWIPVEPGIFEHRKILSLADQLGVEPEQAVVHLLRFWFWCMRNAKGQQGWLDGITPRHVARAARWHGDSETFYLALTRAELIDEFTTGPASVHGWAERYGLLAAKNEATRQRVAEHRMYRALQEHQEQLPLDGEDVTVTAPLPSRISNGEDTLRNALQNMTEQNMREHEIPHGASQARPEGGVPAPAPRKKQPYAEQFMALCHAFGIPPDTENPIQRKKVALAAAALGKDNITGAQIDQFPDAWRRLFPNARASPVAYAAHAAQLANEVRMADPKVRREADNKRYEEGADYVIRVN